MTCFLFISVFGSKLPKQTQTKKQANACLLFWDLTEVRINRRLARASPSLMTCSSESHCTTFEAVNSHERNRIADKATQLSGFCCIYATWEFTHKGADVQQNQSYEVRLCLRFYLRGDRRIAAQIITLDDNLRRNPQQSTAYTPLHKKKRAEPLRVIIQTVQSTLPVQEDNPRDLQTYTKLQYSSDMVYCAYGARYRSSYLPVRGYQLMAYQSASHG